MRIRTIYENHIPLRVITRSILFLSDYKSNDHESNGMFSIFCEVKSPLSIHIQGLQHLELKLGPYDRAKNKNTTL